ncbi:MAG: YlmH/Sll1252 family protein [Bacillota bacterium]|nr:YlmH/Sll1252 family protein [Bacillota bacterium]
MKKEDFIKFMTNEDEAAVLRLYDRLSIAEKSGKTVHTNEFYTPAIWSKVLVLSPDSNINILCDGFFEEAERRMIIFNVEDYTYQPMKVLCIQNKSKFHELKHKDYLGAVMSLGVKREKFGDLIVNGNKCYCAVCEDIALYIEDNLSTIGHCPCEVIEVNEYDIIPSPGFEEKVIVTTSMRADCLVSSISGLSRSKSVDLIKAGKVLINYNEIKEKDYVIVTSSTVTIRGFGKFKVGEVVGNSGSGRLKVLVKKFI